MKSSSHTIYHNQGTVQDGHIVIGLNLRVKLLRFTVETRIKEPASIRTLRLKFRLFEPLK